MVELGFNYRLTDVMAALGTSQMARLGEFLSARRRLAARYTSALAGAADAFGTRIFSALRPPQLAA